MTKSTKTLFVLFCLSVFLSIVHSEISLVRPSLSCEAQKFTATEFAEVEQLKSAKRTPLAVCLYICTLTNQCDQVSWQTEKCDLLRLLPTNKKQMYMGDPKTTLTYGNIKCKESLDTDEVDRYERGSPNKDTLLFHEIMIEDFCRLEITNGSRPSSISTYETGCHLEVKDDKHCFDVCRAYGIPDKCSSYIYHSVNRSCIILENTGHGTPVTPDPDWYFYHDIKCKGGPLPPVSPARIPPIDFSASTAPYTGPLTTAGTGGTAPYTGPSATAGTGGTAPYTGPLTTAETGSTTPYTGPSTTAGPGGTAPYTGPLTTARTGGTAPYTGPLTTAETGSTTPYTVPSTTAGTGGTAPYTGPLTTAGTGGTAPYTGPLTTAGTESTAPYSGPSTTAVTERPKVVPGQKQGPSPGPSATTGTGGTAPYTSPLTTAGTGRTTPNTCAPCELTCPPCPCLHNTETPITVPRTTPRQSKIRTSQGLSSCMYSIFYTFHPSRKSGKYRFSSFSLQLR